MQTAEQKRKQQQELKQQLMIETRAWLSGIHKSDWRDMFDEEIKRIEKHIRTIEFERTISVDFSDKFPREVLRYIQGYLFNLGYSVQISFSGYGAYGTPQIHMYIDWKEHA